MALSGTFETFQKMKATGRIGSWFADGRARSKTDDSPRRETWEQSQQHQDEYARLHVTTTGSLDRITVDRRRCDLRFEIVDREPVPDREEELRKRKGSFFADMEANMLRRMERDNIIKERPLPHQAVSPEECGSEEKAAEETSYGANSKNGSIDKKKKEDGGSRRRRPRPRRVISRRGNSLVIAKLVNGGNERQKERRRIVGVAPLPATAEGACEDSLRDSVESVKSEAHRTSPRQLPNRRRNSTCGTIDARSTTMSSAPDDEEEAMIRCVCSIIWAHTLQSARSNDASSAESLPSAQSNEYEVFNDRPSSSAAESSSSAAVPSLDEIVNFYRDIFRRCQMESDCVVISLIYVERLVKGTGGSLRPSSTNWRSLLLSCLVLASKVWDDLSMDSGDFSRACRDALPGDAGGAIFTPERITRLELAAFGCLGFEAGVSASEYAKYYFLLRSAMVRSGLSAKVIGGGEADGRSSSTIASSLNVEGTRRLKRMMSSNFTPCVTRRRSVGEVEEMIGRSSSYRRIKQEQLVRL